MPLLIKDKRKLDAPTLTPAELAKVDIKNKPPGINVSRRDWNLWRLSLEVRRQYGMSLDKFMPLLEFDETTTLANLREQVREIKKLRLFTGAD